MAAVALAQSSLCERVTGVSRNTDVTYGIACNPADPAAGASPAALPSAGSITGNPADHSPAALPSAGGEGGAGGGSGAGAAVAVAQGANEAIAECKNALQTPLQHTLMSEETMSSAKASTIENKEPPAKKPRIIEAVPSSSLTRTLLENEQLPLKKPRVIEAARAGGGEGDVSSSTDEKPTCIERPCESKAAAAGGKAEGIQEKVEEKKEEKMEEGGLGGRAHCSNGCEGDDNGIVRWCVPCKRYDNYNNFNNNMIIIISRPVQAVRPLSLYWKDVE